MKKPFCIRLDYSAQEQVKQFAETNGMKQTAAAHFLLLFGIKAIGEVVSIEQKFERIESLLAKMQKSDYRALVYLVSASSSDQARLDSATRLAEKNVQEIFGTIKNMEES